jgi:monofunctional biosynthetic peptidoglycan transglycosylase
MFIRKALKYSLIVFGISLLPVFIYKWINPSFTWIQSSQSELRKYEGEWIEIEEIPNHFELAALAGEDQRFFEHNGFDFKAIEQAINHNMKGGSVRGASTISQQTAKNVFCWEGRSWIRKGLETYYTIWIELIWGKKRILEVYLNVIEMGRGAFGIDEAAHYYYSKSGKDLTRQESINIISMLPCPRTCGTKHPIARKRQNAINRAMKKYGLKLDY